MADGGYLGQGLGAGGRGDGHEGRAVRRQPLEPLIGLLGQHARGEGSEVFPLEEGEGGWGGLRARGKGGGSRGVEQRGRGSRYQRGSAGEGMTTPDAPSCPRVFLRCLGVFEIGGGWGVKGSVTKKGAR